MVAAACSVGFGGLAEALFKMGLGNRIGFKMMADRSTGEMFEPMYGSIVLEMVSDSPAGELLGETTEDYIVRVLRREAGYGRAAGDLGVQAGARVPLPQGRPHRGEDQRPA